MSQARGREKSMNEVREKWPISSSFWSSREKPTMQEVHGKPQVAQCNGYITGTIINFVAILHYKVFLLEYLFGLQSHKNWSILTKFGYILAVRNLSLYKKNCMLHSFYKDTPNFWIFVLTYVPLFINLCDNVITRMSSIVSF